MTLGPQCFATNAKRSRAYGLKLRRSAWLAACGSAYDWRTEDGMRSNKR
jgi:hypothetical protein